MFFLARRFMPVLLVLISPIFVCPVTAQDESLETPVEEAPVEKKAPAAAEAPAAEPPPAEEKAPAGKEAPAEDKAPAEQEKPAATEDDDDSEILEEEEVEAKVVDEAKEVDDESAYPHLELLTESLLHVRKHYVDEKTYKEITYGAIRGMLRSLDSHSSFLEPEEYDEMREDTAGKFSGIGIHIGMRDGYLTVIAPIEGTPGFRAGLQSGDKIVGIEGKKTSGITLRDAVKKLRGTKGTKVVIKVLSIGDKEAREIEIIRDDITVPSVKGARIIRDGVGYIRITQFARPTSGLLVGKLEELLAGGMDALVLDLRGNPGGLLKSAIQVSQVFFKRGKVIVSTRGREGVHDEIITKSGGRTHLTDFPIAILVNGGSASASEIVAGALQDHQRAVLVGSKTFGKGSVQSVIPVGPDKKTAVRLTIAYYYTPSGRLIHDKGIEPNIAVPLTNDEWRRAQIRRAHEESPELYTQELRDEYKDAVDRQLQRAVDLLQAIKIFK